MFVHKIDEDIYLRLIDLNDAERVFELTDTSRSYLKEWLPWLDFTKSAADTKEFIRGCLKGYADSKS
ncbi:MAG: RimJ/RimL family protein N-acetyltransferase, partial [Bacillaceae bacterium]|nr:RimJ/RimL family protein N-acetyltransferase [Bacillaceae bacterium]